MGNICRSPTAEGVFKKQVADKGLGERFEISSAGTDGWHVGNPPDDRAQQAARERNIDISSLRATQITPEDIIYYDDVIAMDKDNLARLKSLAAEHHHHKIRLLLEDSDSAQVEVPDPYYGGDHGFELVLDMIEGACEALLDKWVDR